MPVSSSFAHNQELIFRHFYVHMNRTYLDRTACLEDYLLSRWSIWKQLRIHVYLIRQNDKASHQPNIIRAHDSHKFMHMQYVHISLLGNPRKGTMSEWVK